MTVDEARAYLALLSSHPERRGDTAFLNPEFAIKLATAVQQARTEGIPASLMSGFREPTDHPSSYDLGGNSSHTYGLASDVGGIGAMGSSTALRWAQIAQNNGLSNPYGSGDAAEYNHWQLPSQPLEKTPELLGALKTAKDTGNINSVWAAYTPQSAGGGGGRFTADQIFNAIYGQESDYGRNAAAGNNVMQIQPGTFAKYAQPGEDINDRAVNIAVGHRIINDYFQRFGGDPARIATAYFSGEANVNPSGALAYLNDSSDGSKKVSGYVADIMRRLGAPAPAGAAAVASGGSYGPSSAQLAGMSIGQTLAELGGSEESAALGSAGGAHAVNEGEDQPAIRMPALEGFATPAYSPVPASLAGGMGSQLAQLGIQTQTQPPSVDSITQGAPGMSALLGQIGAPEGNFNPLDPWQTNAPNPNRRMPRLS